MRRRKLDDEDVAERAAQRELVAFCYKRYCATTLLGLYLQGKGLAQAWREVRPESRCTDASARQQASRLLRWGYDLPISRRRSTAPNIATCIKMKHAEKVLVLHHVHKYPLSQAWREIKPHSRCSDASAQQQASRLLKWLRENLPSRSPSLPFDISPETLDRLVEEGS